jgi:hypothetical protein
MSEITLSVVIMAHPKRADFVEELRGRLDRPDVPVVWDEKNDRWDTGRRSMLAYDPACSHHLVIQDDILVCRDPIASFQRALEFVPDAPLCGYVGRWRPEIETVGRAVAQADKVGASFITMPTLNWGPAIAVPTSSIPEMIAYCDPLVDVLNYDKRLSRYWELSRQIRVWYTWPSLVDHADGPSLVPGRYGTDRAMRARSRVAHHFIGEEISGVDHDWTGPVVDSLAAGEGRPRILVYRNRRDGMEVRLSPWSPRVRRMAGLNNWEFVGEVKG